MRKPLDGVSCLISKLYDFSQNNAYGVPQGDLLGLEQFLLVIMINC